MKISFSVARRLPGMTLQSMRSTGVRSVAVRCVACPHQAVLNVDAYADAETLPSFAEVMRCTACGSRKVDVRPLHGWE